MLDLHQVLKTDPSRHGTIESLKNYWDKALFLPWQDVRGRPSKAIRSQFVELGWKLSGAPPLSTDNIVGQIGEIVETLHLGSLIIDDIEDNSEERRGGPALHHIYGLPLALNLGNFLYFQAMSMVSELNLSDEFKNQAIKQIVHSLRDAHLGQALDISVAIDQVERQKIPKLVETSLRLKSGALMKLSIHLGALLNPEFKKWDELHEFGESYGSCLQKFDDIGNFTANSSTKKHLEDLLLRRPTWIWSVFATEAPEAEWLRFVESVRALPNQEKLDAFLASSHLKGLASKMAQEDLNRILRLLKDNFQLNDLSPAYTLALQLTEKLTNAY